MHHGSPAPHRAAIIRLPPPRCYSVGRECGELGEIIRVIFEAIVIALDSGRLAASRHRSATLSAGGQTLNLYEPPQTPVDRSKT